MHPLRLLTAQPRWCCICLTARTQAHLGSLSSLRCADVQAGPMGGVSVADSLWPGSCRPGVRLPARTLGSAGEQQHCSGTALSPLPMILGRCQSARCSWAQDGPAIRVAGIELQTWPSLTGQFCSSRASSWRSHLGCSKAGQLLQLNHKAA